MADRHANTAAAGSKGTGPAQKGTISLARAKAIVAAYCEGHTGYLAGNEQLDAALDLVEAAPAGTGTEPDAALATAAEVVPADTSWAALATAIKNALAE